MEDQKPLPVKRGRPKKSSSKKEDDTTLHAFNEPTKLEKLQALHDQWHNCKRCHLGDLREGEDIVFADGNPDSDIMIIGEAPGEEEMVRSIPFVGASGRLLNKMLAMISDDKELVEFVIDYEQQKKKSRAVSYEGFYEKLLEWRQKEFFTTNIISCRPPENREPLPHEIKPCFERLLNLIYIVDPKLIITTGRTALEVLLRKNVEITRRRGELFDIQIKGRIGKVTYPVLAILHPSWLLRRADYGDKNGDFWKTVRDLHKGMRYIDGIRAHHMGIPIPERPEV